MTTATLETKPMSDEQLILSETDGHLGIVRLNRPKVLNALNPALMKQLAEQLETFDRDDGVRVIVLAGSERAWAAGADIGDMAERSMLEMYQRDQFATWERIKRVKKPIVAAVSGWALGGGCELMMLCDVVIAWRPSRSVSLRSTSASCRGPGARNGSRGRWARPPPWT